MQGATSRYTSHLKNVAI